MNKKPLGHKSYGSIPHLPGSRRGPGDRGLQDKQAAIAIEKLPSKHHHLIVQEKLDGANVGVAKINGEIVPLSRAGYHARTSPYEQHHMFADWVRDNQKRFDMVLDDGERLCGEWLAQAHGTRYDLEESMHEYSIPFVAFDIMKGHERLVYDEFESRVSRVFNIPGLIYKGQEAIPIDEAMSVLKRVGNHYGFHGALEPCEGAVWRVEFDRQVKGGRKREVLFLAKYVMHDKVDGKHFPSISGEPEVWNWRPEGAHSPIEGFRQGWKDIQDGNVLPVSELWDGIDSE
ncbi:MAG: RNA ligase family protein [Pseudomonadota bacterium]